MISSDLSSDIINRYNSDASQIIQILNDLQQHYGYLPREELAYISKEIQLPLSKIWGVITFYSHYKIEPPAKHTVRICVGTACHVKNSVMLKDTFERHVGPKNNNLYSTEKVACLGCCALAPVFEINGKIHGKLDTSKTRKLAEDIRSDIDE